MVAMMAMPGTSRAGNRAGIQVSHDGVGRVMSFVRDLL
jgi:hypothetical protein